MDEQQKFAAFSQALSQEVACRANEIADDVNTLYIGGGTPSVLPLSVFEHLLHKLGEYGHGAPYKEFTVEVNPEDIVLKGHSYVEGLLRLGVNRISMGVQSFDDAILKWMNRRHDSRTARDAYAILEEAGVPNISIDLIFGLSQLSDDQWRETLDKALSISSKGALPHHISSYQLSVEPGSALALLVERGQWSEASEELCSRQYEILCDRLRQAGYHHYEISNFAQPGYEAVHNSAYWNHVPYVGLGPGAHSYIKTVSPSVAEAHVRKWNKSDIVSYTNAAGRDDFSSVTEQEELTRQQLALEHVMLGLRTSSGLPEAYLREHCDAAAIDAALSSGNIVKLDTGNIRIPESKFFISDSIICDL